MRAYESIDGWWSPECDAFYREMVEQAPPAAHFVEVGAWVGRSAASMAEAIRDSGRDDIRFDSVDTWEGTPEEGDGGYHQRLIEEQGLNLREQFEQNLREHGLWRYVNPIRADSVEAAELYEDRSLDMVMIDGDHRREMVERDARAWEPKLRYGGVLAGDDAGNENVQAGIRGAEIYAPFEGRIWRWRKHLDVDVQSYNPLTAGILAGKGRSVFGDDMADWAREVLPRYFSRGGGLVMADCDSPLDADLFLCPCDDPVGEGVLGGEVLRRAGSAERGRTTFPAFPHGDWPFLDRGWVPPEIEGPGPIAGFVGVPRPPIRRRALEAVEESVETRYTFRERFMGQDVDPSVARREYMDALTGCHFQVCVRGVGNFCYRLYETMAAGGVPIFVGTNRPLPGGIGLDWSDHIVHVPEGEIDTAGERALEFYEEHAGHWREIQLANRRMWWEHLSPVGWWRNWARSR